MRPVIIDPAKPQSVVARSTSPGCVRRDHQVFTLPTYPARQHQSFILLFRTRHRGQIKTQRDHLPSQLRLSILQQIDLSDYRQDLGPRQRCLVTCRLKSAHHHAPRTPDDQQPTPLIWSIPAPTLQYLTFGNENVADTHKLPLLVIVTYDPGLKVSNQPPPTLGSPSFHHDFLS